MSKDLQSVRVTVHSGKVKDADWVGKSDPYVILSLDGTKWKSVTKDNTLTPEWNETWEFPIKSQNPVLEIQCYDADPGQAVCSVYPYVCVYPPPQHHHIVVDELPAAKQAA